MKVDILIPVAEKGGCENIINMLVPFLQKERNWDIRVVQLIYEDITWIKDRIPYFPLLQGRYGHNLEELVTSYADFLNTNGNPDVILATAWPFMCYIAKKAVSMTHSLNTFIFSWLHAPVKRYAEAGFGSFQHIALANAHLTISNSIADEITFNLPNSIIIPVHNPVDFEASKISVSKHTEHTPSKNLYFIGRVSEEKRIDLMIRALTNTNGAFKLCIIGEGEKALTEKLYKLAKKLHVSEYIEWLGWQNSPWQHVKDAEALILASDYEGFPLSAIEALSNGIPVISTPVSGITDVITPGTNGYLFPFGDWQTLHKILMLIADDKLPPISPNACFKSVEHHNMNYALLDFSNKIETFVQKENGTK